MQQYHFHCRFWLQMRWVSWDDFITRRQSLDVSDHLRRLEPWMFAIIRRREHPQIRVRIRFGIWKYRSLESKRESDQNWAISSSPYDSTLAQSRRRVAWLVHEEGKRKLLCSDMQCSVVSELHDSRYHFWGVIIGLFMFYFVWVGGLFCTAIFYQLYWSFLILDKTIYFWIGCYSYKMRRCTSHWS